MTKSDYLLKLELLYIQCGNISGPMKPGGGLEPNLRQPNIELMAAIEKEKGEVELLPETTDWELRDAAFFIDKKIAIPYIGEV